LEPSAPVASPEMAKIIIPAVANTTPAAESIGPTLLNSSTPSICLNLVNAKRVTPNTPAAVKQAASNTTYLSSTIRALLATTIETEIVMIARTAKFTPIAKWIGVPGIVFPFISLLRVDPKYMARIPIIAMRAAETQTFWFVTGELSP
jgi:hypothetical protein